MSQVLFCNNLQTWTHLKSSRTDMENLSNQDFSNPYQGTTGCQGLFFSYSWTMGLPNGYCNITGQDLAVS